MQLLRKISLSGSLLLALLLISTMWVGVTAAAAFPTKTNTFPTVRQISASHSTNSNADLLRRLVSAGRLAPAGAGADLDRRPRRATAHRGPRAAGAPVVVPISIVMP